MLAQPLKILIGTGVIDDEDSYGRGVIKDDESPPVQKLSPFHN